MYQSVLLKRIDGTCYVRYLLQGAAFKRSRLCLFEHQSMIFQSMHFQYDSHRACESIELNTEVFVIHAGKYTAKFLDWQPYLIAWLNRKLRWLTVVINYRISWILLKTTTLLVYFLKFTDQCWFHVLDILYGRLIHVIPNHYAYDVLYFPGWYSEWSDSWAYLHMAFISRQVCHNKSNAIRWRNAVFKSVEVTIICEFIRFVLMV